jgi:hypothetical protein
MTAPYFGQCLCGALRFRITAEPLTMYACHCVDCQRRTGAAFALSMLVRRSALELHQWTCSAQPWFVFSEGATTFETQPDDPAEMVALWKRAHG